MTSRCLGAESLFPSRTPRTTNSRCGVASHRGRGSGRLRPRSQYSYPVEHEHFPGVTTSADVSRRSLPCRRSLRGHSEPKLLYWVTFSRGSWTSKHSTAWSIRRNGEALRRRGSLSRLRSFIRIGPSHRETRKQLKFAENGRAENGGRYRPGRAGAGSQCGCQMGGGLGKRGAGGRPAAAVRAAAVGLRLPRALRRLLA